MGADRDSVEPREIARSHTGLSGRSSAVAAKEFNGFVPNLIEIEDLSITNILLALVHSNNMNRPIVIERLARVLYSHLSSDIKSIQIVLSNDGIPALMKNVSSSLHSNPSLEGILMCLGQISWKSAVGRRELSEIGNLEMFSALMKEEQMDNIFRKVATVVANLAIDKSVGQLMVEKTNIVSNLLTGFSQKSVHCRTACTWALRNISRSKGAPVELVDMGALVLFSDVMRSPTTYPHLTRENVACTLANMSMDMATHLPITQKCLDGVVNLMKTSTLVDEVRGCIRLVSNIATNADARPALLVLNSTQILLRHLSEQQPNIFPEIKADTARAVGNLCLCEEGQRIAAASDGVAILVDVLAKSITQEDYQCIADTIWAITCLCSKREDLQSEVMAHAGMVKVIEASKIESPQIQYFAARCFEAFSEFPSIQQHLIEQNGLEPLSLLSHLPNPLIRQRAKRALYLLAYTNRSDESRSGNTSMNRSAAVNDDGPPPPPPPMEALSKLGLNSGAQSPIVSRGDMEMSPSELRGSDKSAGLHRAIAAAMSSGYRR